MAKYCISLINAIFVLNTIGDSLFLSVNTRKSTKYWSTELVSDQTIQVLPKVKIKFLGIYIQFSWKVRDSFDNDSDTYTCILHIDSFWRSTFTGVGREPSLADWLHDRPSVVILERRDRWKKNLIYIQRKPRACVICGSIIDQFPISDTQR